MELKLWNLVLCISFVVPEELHLDFKIQIASIKGLKASLGRLLDLIMTNFAVMILKG